MGIPRHGDLYHYFPEWHKCLSPFHNLLITISFSSQISTITSRAFKMKVQTEKKIETPEGLTTVSPKNGEIVDDPTLIQDAVFGEITEDGPNYRNVSRLSSL